MSLKLHTCYLLRPPKNFESYFIVGETAYVWISSHFCRFDSIKFGSCSAKRQSTAFFLTRSTVQRWPDTNQLGVSPSNGEYFRETIISLSLEIWSYTWVLCRLVARIYSKCLPLNQSSGCRAKWIPVSSKVGSPDVTQESSPPTRGIHLKLGCVLNISWSLKRWNAPEAFQLKSAQLFVVLMGAEQFLYIYCCCCSFPLFAFPNPRKIEMWNSLKKREEG